MTATSDRVQIVVNGTARTYARPLTVQSLLQQNSIPEDRTAVELNRTILPRTEFCRELESGDQIEIVRLVGGG